VKRPAILWVAVAFAALSGCSADGTAPVQGYVDGTYVYLSAETGGRLAERPASAGLAVAEGDVLFRLDDADEQAAVAGAEARLSQAKAQLADLKLGKRDLEIGVIAAQLSQARTAFANAEEDYRRKLLLRERGFVAQSVVDDAKAARDQAEAAAEATERQLGVAKLPARPDEIDAAERNVAALEASLAQSRIALARRVVKAPAAGLVEETYYEPGELVAAGQPVASLLPDANRKIRFYVPEASLAGLAVGQPVALSCDGCAAGLAAKIDFIATESEFTPPILYSQSARQKLVYRVEARPEGGAARLKVGQPVDVTLPEPGRGS
jgi:HlyD family secretion protein